MIRSALLIRSDQLCNKPQHILPCEVCRASLWPQTWQQRARFKQPMVHFMHTAAFLPLSASLQLLLSMLARHCRLCKRQKLAVATPMHHR